jgi:DNA-directed RNA polymerase specialized sigma24 family protein
MDKPAQWLEIVAKDHAKWIKLVESFGEYQYKDDIVQEAYLALYKYTNAEKIIHNGKVSEGYMYFTLKTITYQFYNAKNKIQKVSLDDEENVVYLTAEDTIEEQEAFHKICVLIDQEMESWSWYNRRLTELYRDTDMSIRKIAAATNISFVSIFNTLKNCKNEIKQKLQEDFEDYKNGDFDKIQEPRIRNIQKEP